MKPSRNILHGRREWVNSWSLVPASRAWEQGEGRDANVAIHSHTRAVFGPGGRTAVARKTTSTNPAWIPHESRMNLIDEWPICWVVVTASGSFSLAAWRFCFVHVATGRLCGPWLLRFEISRPFTTEDLRPPTSKLRIPLRVLWNTSCFSNFPHEL